MVCAVDAGMAGTVQGVCSHVRRFKKAREEGMAKARLVWQGPGTWLTRAFVLRKGMLASCVGVVVVNDMVGLFGAKSDGVGRQWIRSRYIPRDSG